MKAVVFAYHDMGCTGIQALLDAGYDIEAVPLPVWRLNKELLSMPLKMLTTRCGLTAFVRCLQKSFSLSTTAIC